MTPYERELLLAMARFIVSERGDRLALIKAIEAVERDERCPFDGNPVPCPHHTSQEKFSRIITERRGPRT